MSNAPATVLVDASIYVFRGWFSIPPDFTDQQGRPVNALHGFARFLCELLAQRPSSQIACAFDESLASSFRNQIYPPYKANREPPPAELERQFAECRQLCQALGIAQFADREYEADDIIGTLAYQARERGQRVEIVSADKDLAQLLQGDDVLWDYARAKRYNSAAIEERFGVKPEQIADFLALAGDSVDNIPGVPGVGPKAAAALLQHFGNFDRLYERLNEVVHLRFRGAKRCAALLKEHREMAEISRKIVQIHCQVPALDHAPELKRSRLQAADLEPLMEQWRFGPMLRRQCLGNA
jgi:5'-3' exonuclease